MAATVEDFRKCMSLDTLYGSESTEHSKIEPSSMDARDSARLSAGELAAAHASYCQDGKRGTLGVSDDHGATIEDTRQDGKGAVVEDFRKRISLDAFFGNDLTQHSKIERSIMEARYSARLGAGKLAAGHASDCQDGKRNPWRF